MKTRNQRLAWYRQKQRRYEKQLARTDLPESKRRALTAVYGEMMKDAVRFAMTNGESFSTPAKHHVWQ